ncbi:MAG: hypothetical protein R3F11_31895 [Verrucomicrobiales bacterium]
MKLTLILLLAVASLPNELNGALPLLIDINRAGSGNTATASEFAAAGVEESLSGASVTGISVPSAPGFGFTGGGITFTFSDTYTASYDVGSQGANLSPSHNSLLDSYVYLNRDGEGGGPVVVSVAGLSIYLQPLTRYRLYLFGAAGENEAQTASFSFPISSPTKITGVPGDPSDATVSFYFMTGPVVSDVISFGWARVGTQQYSALNGIAITRATYQTAQPPVITKFELVSDDVQIQFLGIRGMIIRLSLVLI